MLLDLMLPGVDGIDLMKEIVSASDVPVIFVSAYGQDQLVAKAFEVGADDYVVKPFSPTELVARIRAALRRRTTSEPSVPYVRGRPDHRLRGAPRDAWRESHRPDGHTVPVAGRAIGQRRPGADLRAPAEAGMGLGWRRRPAAHAHRHQCHTRQAARRRPATRRTSSPSFVSATACQRQTCLDGDLAQTPDLCLFLSRQRKGSRRIAGKLPCLSRVMGAQ